MEQVANFVPHPAEGRASSKEGPVTLPVSSQVVGYHYLNKYQNTI